MFQPDHSPKVFISYSHDSAEHMDRVLALAERLRSEGVDCNIDQYEIAPSEGWYQWLRTQLEWTDFVVVVCTEQYYLQFLQFRGREELGKGRKVTWEGSIITQELYYNSDLKSIKFIPVVFSAQDINYIPIIFRALSMYSLDTEEGYTTLYRHLTNQPSSPVPVLGEIPLAVNKPLDDKRLEDVFKRSGIPTHTFVKPVEYQRLFVALRTPGRGLVVEGPSGVGKTTCVLKVLEQLSLHDRRIKILTARRRQDTEEIVLLPEKNSYDIIILDDFHVLEDKAKQLIADYMKVIADEEKAIKLVLIGINKAGNSLVKLAKDLNNRIETIRFGINPENNVIELVKKGEEALKIKFNETLLTNIVK
ncbi:SEFIR domain-containing protein, partial [Brasilonema bromeliae]|uniref:SEFIR domain-containing protein n=1 Tax=Brasilonema bromeliae TaxID=383615 RepID=UPI00145DA128